MNSNVKWRVVAFVLAIGLTVSLSVWAALASWQRIDLMRGRLTSVLSESFHLADHLQQSILSLNNVLLRYQIRHDLATWQQFLSLSQDLEGWIRVQTPVWNTPEEEVILQQLRTNYQAYLKDARQLENQRKLGDRPVTSLADFAPFETQSERLVDLAYQLANAHRKSLSRVMQNSDVSLVQLRNLMFSSLILSLVFGVGLALMVYRQMIAPLRLIILENRELMARQEKLASLGLLAAGVAHEIRNPLTAMKARLYALDRLAGPDSPEQEDLKVIGNEISRLERIVKDFLLFARPSEPTLAVVNADQPLREVQALMAPPLLKANIQLTLENSATASVKIDSEQIKQVLINLVQNAADSIGQNGAIILRSHHATKRLAGQMIEAVVLEVSDTGKGIHPEARERLFDPFFTTKQGGTGLGLSIAARIVEKHGGALQYQSQVNRGTTFGIVLPQSK